MDERERRKLHHSRWAAKNRSNPKYFHICRFCKEWFFSFDLNAKYGSHRCRSRARKKRTETYWKRFHATWQRAFRKKRRTNPAMAGKHNAYLRTKFSTMRVAAIMAYGGPKCVCDHDGTPCGPKPMEWLALDHINGVKFGPSRRGTAFMQYLKRNNYPKGIRVLCHNCNCALGFYGHCPQSKTERQDVKQRKHG